MGDWLLNQGQLDRGALEELAIAELWRPGSNEALWVMPHLVPDSWSLKESETRSVLRFAGLPDPECNRRLDPNREEGPIPDLLYRRWCTAVEYEGAHHQEDRHQYGHDLDRYKVFRDRRIAYVQVTDERLRHARRVVRAVHRILVQQGYDGPEPRFSEHWRTMFMSVAAVLGERADWRGSAGQRGQRSSYRRTPPRHHRWRRLASVATDRGGMTILLCDPRVGAVVVRENGDPLVRLDESFGPARALVRSGLAARLDLAQNQLPRGLALQVVEGHRSVADQRAIIAHYSGQVCDAHPGVSPDELHRLVSRFVAPVDVAPHVAGAAVDLTLVGVDETTGRAELDLGTPIDATPEQSGGRCFTAAEVSPKARRLRDLLAGVLNPAGLVNYPTEWWHWSYGDRYWALHSDAAAAPYGPVLRSAVAA